MTEVNLEVERLADQLERSCHGGAWHGPAVFEVLDGIDASVAKVRPGGDAHSIWEITGHTAAWMRVAAGRIRGLPGPTLSEDENFPVPEVASEAEWEAVVADLRSALRDLLGAVRDLEDASLGDPVPGSDPTVRGLILGVLQHNAYHSGQIALLRKVVGEGGGGS